MAVLGILGSAPGTFGLSSFSARGATADAVRAQEWWLAALNVGPAWQTDLGSGITVAVLGTGVAAGHPDLGGEVITGPDYSGSGRAPGGPYWGIEGTAVAGIIAGHGHGNGGGAGMLGIAPRARILSIRVSLEYNDPLNSNQAITRRLPDAIAAGIRYAVGNGARVIDLPLDPGSLGLTAQGDPAAAGGSTAEQAAVAYALSKNVVLVAPAGNDGQGPGIVNYPAAYPGVIAVGAVDRNGQLALFSSRRSYVSLTAPGADLVAAAPPSGYGQISTTGTASGLVAGLAALLLARFPHLTVAQVTQALTESTVPTAGATAENRTTAGGTTEAAKLPPLPARSANGAGYGTVNAARAVAVAAIITAPPKAAAPPARPTRSVSVAPRRPAAAPSKAATSTLAGSLVKYVVAGLIALIALLAGLLVLMRSRRARGESAPRTGRARTRGMHEHRRPPPAPDSGDAAESRAGSPPAPAWSFAGRRQGGKGESPPPGSSRPAIVPVSRSTANPRPGRAAAGFPGPPWEPASPPDRTSGPLPMMSRYAFPQNSGSGIRVPRDMPTLPAASPGPPQPGSPQPGSPQPGPSQPGPSQPGFPHPESPPQSDQPAFDFTAPAASFDFAMPPAPDLPPRSPADDSPGSTDPTDFPTSPDLRADAKPPTQQSLGFAAAPVATDYAAPPDALDHPAPPGIPDHPAPPGAPGVTPPAAGPEPGNTPVAGPRAADAWAAGPGYIWDLAATDVFPVRADAATPPQPPGTTKPPPTPGFASVEDDAPDASGG